MSQDKKKRVILSVDAETDGLWGRPFAIAAVCYDEDGKEVSRFCARSNEKAKNEWVLENVLPHCEDIEVAGDYIYLLKAFAKYYQDARAQYDVTVLWHMGHVVESFLYRELVSHKLIGEWDAPYCPIEVSAYLERAGYAPDSVDNYAKQNNIALPAGATHNPLYDCEVAFAVYKHIIKR